MSFLSYIVSSFFVLCVDANLEQPTSSFYSSNLTDSIIHSCPPFESIPYANVKIQNHIGSASAIVTCSENYSLIGRNIIYCDDGIWNFGFDGIPPRCVKRCPPPPILEHGEVNLEKNLEDIFNPIGTYVQGTIAKYICSKGYILEPSSSSTRLCQNGYWTGIDAYCRPNEEMSCASPPVIQNGDMQPSLADGYSLVAVGQEVLYECYSGYRLIGPDRIKCTDQGIWLPKPPSCHKETDFFSTIQCASLPLLDSKIHMRIEIGSISSTSVEVGCKSNYQNSLAPCKTSKFYCKKGKWVGVYPKCVEVHMCSSPPAIPYAVEINRNFVSSFGSGGIPNFPINSQITIECLKGYILLGSPVISCQSNGCWGPADWWPTCIRSKESGYFVELDNINAILISSATGAAVMGILLLACLFVACKKRRALANAVTIPSTAASPITSRNSEAGNDHTILLQHPDRLALIAFADGLQNSQNNSLPSYDEATRQRSTLIQVSRLQIQRPHWPNLGICRSGGRNRGSPSTDSGHRVSRHGSSISHTPSMRSGGESMGSTDTVTISEGSTNVTLDTASSHSATSQNPSCRGHCGSLASFDTSSIVNTEGVPLLEESELEEIQGGSNDMDNPAASASADNVSSKISTHSAPVSIN